MPKFSGAIGYSLTVEKERGIFVEQTVYKPCSGDLLASARRMQSSDQIIDNVTIDNRFSIVADVFARENIGNIKSIKYLGVNWKITKIGIEYPRLVFDVGGIYNGK